jgi:hypothetical protein
VRRRPGSYVVCVLLACAALGGVTVAVTHRAGWADIGLWGLAPAFYAAAGVAVLAKWSEPNAHRLVYVVLAIVVSFPPFWLYCLIFTTTGSWIWATAATVVAAYLMLDGAASWSKRRRARKSTEPVSDKASPAG